jgi:WD40 repeat protein
MTKPGIEWLSGPRQGCVFIAVLPQEKEVALSLKTIVTWLTGACLGLPVASPLHGEEPKPRATFNRPVLNFDDFVDSTHHANQAWCLSFSPDSKILASGCDDRTIKLWALPLAKEITTLQQDRAGINSLSFSPDGKTLAWVLPNGTIKLWETAGGKERVAFKGRNGFARLAYSPNGRSLACEDSDGTVSLWNLARGEESVIARCPTGGVHLSFSPDGKSLATGSGDGLRLWDLARGRELFHVNGHRGRVRAVAFSPDGTVLASGGTDDSVRLWSPATATELTVLRGHSDTVLSLSFHREGKILASASKNEIKLWDLATGKNTVTLPPNSDPICVNDWAISVLFSPDGAMLASASATGTIRLWDTDALKQAEKK